MSAPATQAGQRQPTLLASCARATTAAEARYRISYPGFARRSSRVIALGGQSEQSVREMGGRLWGGGHFLVFESAVPGDALLRHAQAGGTALLSEELEGADTVVMIASAGATRGGGVDHRRCRRGARHHVRGPGAAGAAQ